MRRAGWLVDPAARTRRKDPGGEVRARRFGPERSLDPGGESIGPGLSGVERSLNPGCPGQPGPTYPGEGIVKWTRRRFVWQDGGLVELGDDEGGFKPVEPPDNLEEIAAVMFLLDHAGQARHSPGCPFYRGNDEDRRKSAASRWN